MVITFGLWVGALQTAGPQEQSKRLPRFEDYPITEVFQGKPHRPILKTPEQRRYRTRIRQGVEKGWGVWINGEWGKEQNRPGPNFAGHYVVVVWGCGSCCLMMAVADVETGEVFNPPLSTNNSLHVPSLVLPPSAGSAAVVRYRKDSRLIVIKSTPHFEYPNPKSYAFYFLLQDNQWKLLRRVRIKGDP